MTTHSQRKVAGNTIHCRPSSCPTRHSECNHPGTPCKNGICGLRLMPISQAAVIWSIIVYATISMIQHSSSGIKDLSLISAWIALYYFIGFAIIEENHTWDLLPDMGKWTMRFERAIRLLSLGIITVGIVGRTYTSNTPWNCDFPIITCLLFLLWDGIIWRSLTKTHNRSVGIVKSIKIFMWFDMLFFLWVLGFLILLCLNLPSGDYDRYPILGPIIGLAWIGCSPDARVILKRSFRIWDYKMVR